MHIIKVRAREMRRDSHAACVSGVLLLETETGQISLNVTVPAKEASHNALWLDALRQLQRLPEFRRNGRQITLADTAFDGMCAEA
ncbi:conserved hypothetical protein [Roseovarius sp. EC-HK134]|jgi:hypothetical protein|uniref:Uncharacterized protein n=1 Tax=Roseovarius mucosus TaxID=215743 RepID=A0A1V0RPJ3_9RHOB|nr:MULTISPECIES: hypothetical protein [Roseovarius]ARE83703.1 hypothetical protein ROSMUCSMR3_02231 [Roseovarius mucosus]AWZ19666.1 Hypothetical protein RAK1035_0955 [Roseovarius sp. AK1035]EDM33841.1 hypothetical protein RTM1035_17692 [Roseovarius sp. TM1035]MBW4973250.1 hypothetical protein [Roseovarius mucosus]VVT09085.1 conserved hypothetical protein [Roseovarius sp. EC-HK134]|tara:strand:- start:4 stop:258 length:255 start_codon:yes stop_codon:yes gene_type:complete